MAETNWGQLYDSLEIRQIPGELVFEPPSESNFEKFEQAFEMILPKSYRRMLTVFGPGEIGRRFTIKAPGYANRWPDVDLAWFTTKWRQRLFDNVRDDRVKRLTYFCETIWSDLVGWDPSDIRDATGQEYGIYICIHERDTCDYLTDSFDTFINQICLGEGFREFLGADATADFEAAPRIFTRATYPHT